MYICTYRTMDVTRSTNKFRLYDVNRYWSTCTCSSPSYWSCSPWHNTWARHGEPITSSDHFCSSNTRCLPAFPFLFNILILISLPSTSDVLLPFSRSACALYFALPGVILPSALYIFNQESIFDLSPMRACIFNLCKPRESFPRTSHSFLFDTFYLTMIKFLITTKRKRKLCVSISVSDCSYN